MAYVSPSLCRESTGPCCATRAETITDSDLPPLRHEDGCYICCKHLHQFWYYSWFLRNAEDKGVNVPEQIVNIYTHLEFIQIVSSNVGTGLFLKNNLPIICGIKHFRMEYMNARTSPESLFESWQDIFHGDSVSEFTGSQTKIIWICFSFHPH